MSGSNFDWLGKADVTVAESSNVATNLNEGVFTLSYREDKKIMLRPYPIMDGKSNSATTWVEVPTILIMNPNDSSEVLFEEVSPRMIGQRDNVFGLFFNEFNYDSKLRSRILRSSASKYMLCQIIGGTYDESLNGKFVLLRITYALGKAFEESGILEGIIDLIKNPTKSEVITIEHSYSEQREKRIEYKVSLDKLGKGADKLVEVAGSHISVTNKDLFDTWKEDFYESHDELVARLNALSKVNLDLFTNENAKALLTKVKSILAGNANTAVDDTIADAVLSGNDAVVDSIVKGAGVSQMAAQPTPAKESDNPFDDIF